MWQCARLSESCAFGWDHRSRVVASARRVRHVCHGKTYFDAKLGAELSEPVGGRFDRRVVGSCEDKARLVVCPVQSVMRLFKVTSEQRGEKIL